jgi:putative aldouronate transport system substrate-binding protein
MVNEGIFDREAFRHTGTQVDTKMGNFTYLFSAGHISSPNSATKTTNAYYTNPEMRYTWVGPLNFADGSPSVQIESMGQTGCPILAFTRVNRDVEASLRYLDYVNSKEGYELVYYGIEGITFYRNALGQPRLLPSLMEARANRVTDWDEPMNDLGMNIFRRYDFAWMNVEWYGEYSRTSGDPDPQVAAYQLARPIQMLPGYSIEGFAADFPETETLQRLDADQQERTYRERAYFAATEAEARQILASFQTWLRTAEGGVWMRYLDFLAQMARTRSDVAF